MSATTEDGGAPCGNCGASPCYHLCFNSPHFYSPEQERQDDVDYGRWDRFEGWGDPEMHDPYDDAPDWQRDMIVAGCYDLTVPEYYPHSIAFSDLDLSHLNDLPF